MQGHLSLALPVLIQHEHLLADSINQSLLMHLKKRIMINKSVNHSGLADIVVTEYRHFVFGFNSCLPQS